MATVLAPGRRNGYGRAAPPSGPMVVRCAVYARQSVSEGTGESASISVQREACEAFIAAHRAEGWVALPETYADQGISGGTLARPALQRLIVEIDAGRVDAIVTYKLDRISRSVAHFSSLVENLDKRGVRLLSVTQSIDTTSAIGQLLRSVLMSFAEFERSLIRERTRDAVVAARRKGRWTGGVTPLGYRLVEGKLVPDPVEAHQVAEAFRIYLETGSLIETAAEMNARGWLTKVTPTKSGVPRGGKEWNKGNLHGVLTSPLYVGRIVSGADTVEAEHDAITSVETWDAVQARLEENAVAGSRGERRSSEALLAGLLTCELCGSTLSPSCARKGPRVYRYYRCSRQVKGGRAACPAKHVNAVKIEAEVVAQISARAQESAVVQAVLSATKERIVEQKKALASERRALERALRQGDGGATEGYRARLDAIREEAGALGEVVVDAETVAEALRGWDGLWSVLTGRERRRVVELIVGPGGVGKSILGAVEISQDAP